MVFAVGLSAAFCLGLGFVLQQHAAQQAPPSDVLRFRLLLYLLRKPVWLGGVAAMVAGQILGGMALGEADVALVEPILTANLLFALAMARALFRVPMGRREWSGSILLIFGLAAFIIAGQPHGGDPSASTFGRWLTVVVIAGIAAVLVAAGMRRRYGERAMLLAAAAGLLYGVQDGFTRHALHDLSGGFGPFMATWSPYALLAVGIISLLLAQSAFEAAPLRSSLPAITAAEPLAGIAVGVMVFDENLRLAPLALAFEVAGLVAMVIGVLLVARSPVLDHRHPRRHYHPPGISERPGPPGRADRPGSAPDDRSGSPPAHRSGSAPDDRDVHR